MATSSFEYFPGVPIYHSKNLIEWELIGHCLTRQNQVVLEKAKPSYGVWAPTLRYHDGLFYMTTHIFGVGSFYVTSECPESSWSDPLFVDQSGIDPDLFWDDDGSAWFTSGRGIVSQIDLATGALIGPPKELRKGYNSSTGEGVHLYKINGYYYVVMAEGGTGHGHMVTVARSKSLAGPYDACPFNPILTQRSCMDGDLHATGHADIIEAHDGSWWMVFLATREKKGMFPRVESIGRETCIVPISWTEDGWPMVSENSRVTRTQHAVAVAGSVFKAGAYSEAEEAYVIPDAPLQEHLSFAQDGVPNVFKRNNKDYANIPLPSPYWQFLRNPDLRNYHVTPNAISIDCTKETLTDISSPSFFARRQLEDHFTFTAKLIPRFSERGDEGGLALYQNPSHHYAFFLSEDSAGRFGVGLRKTIGDMVTTFFAPIDTCFHGVEKGYHLSIEATPDVYHFYLQIPEQERMLVGTGQARYLSIEVATGFTGLFMGIYAAAKTAASSGSLDVLEVTSAFRECESTKIE